MRESGRALRVVDRRGRVGELLRVVARGGRMGGRKRGGLSK
jgi:hypothetical protein